MIRIFGYIRLPLIMILLSLIISCGVKRGVSNLTPPLYNKLKVDVDANLVKKIAEYWHYRKSNQPKKSFDYEYRKIKGYKLDKPYRYYVKYMSRAKIDKIEIVSRKDYKEGSCFDLKFYLTESNRLNKKYFLKQDCWIKDNKSWFHILSNKLIFKY